ncbi:MAG: hypothetical protein DMG76_27385 [Acidobacteria bacterium]|nr:MAG: hypothetical protein DMG76_27385 [Acidobacteriota bacterium]
MTLVVARNHRPGRPFRRLPRRPLCWREIAAPAKPQVLDTPARNARPRMPISVKKRKWTPPANHPWHQAVRREVQKLASKLAATASRPSLAWPSASS